MFDHVTGRTISAEVRTGIFDLLKNTSARIINEATGVAFIRETAGFEKSLNRLLLYDKAAPKAPANVPIINPASILKSEVKMQEKKSSSLKREEGFKRAYGRGKIYLISRKKACEKPYSEPYYAYYSPFKRFFQFYKNLRFILLYSRSRLRAFFRRCSWGWRQKVFRKEK